MFYQRVSCNSSPRSLYILFIKITDLRSESRLWTFLRSKLAKPCPTTDATQGSPPSVLPKCPTNPLLLQFNQQMKSCHRHSKYFYTLFFYQVIRDHVCSSKIGISISKSNLWVEVVVQGQTECFLLSTRPAVFKASASTCLGYRGTPTPKTNIEFVV